MKPHFLVILAGIYCCTISAQENRSYDGSENNAEHPEWGAAGGYFANYMSNGFFNLVSEPAGQTHENQREICNTLGSQSEFMPNELGLSDFVWGWGQLIDHDINLNDDDMTAPFNVLVPQCDVLFDPFCTDTMQIKMFRSKFDLTTGTSSENSRKHINESTSYQKDTVLFKTVRMSFFFLIRVRK